MKIYNKNERQAIINSFNHNEIVIMLTDTVYGIMAKANRENELKINKLKHSDLNKKISIIFPDKEEILKYLEELPEENLKLLKDKLPGAYTFIVNLNNFSDFERNDFGVRVTTYDYLQGILKEVGPVLATSCNITGDEVCMSPEEIEKVFKMSDINLVLDNIAINKPSTIIDIRKDNKIIRE